MRSETVLLGESGLNDLEGGTVYPFSMRFYG